MHLLLTRQIMFFGIVGLVTLIIDVSVAKALYSIFEFPAYLASALGFMSGFFFNFPMNRNRVFRHSYKDRFSMNQQVVLVLTLSLFNLMFTSALVDFVVRLDILDIALAKILATAIIAIWNFMIFKLLIFSKK